MPELPEVETIVQGLNKQILNSDIIKINLFYDNLITSSKSNFKKTFINNKITSITRHGKYIFLHLNNEKTVVVHLRMTGQLFTIPFTEKIDKHTHLELYFFNKKFKLIYRDIRKFGRFNIIKRADLKKFILEKKLAPDALLISSKIFYDNLLNKRSPIKQSLLDQHIIAGIGNIYADEILYAEKIHPLTPTNSISKDKIVSILKTTKKILKKAVLKKGTTFSDYVNSYGNKGKFQLELQAYNRKDIPCCSCSSKITKIKVAGRGTYFCPSCQIN